MDQSEVGAGSSVEEEKVYSLAEGKDAVDRG